MIVKLIFPSGPLETNAVLLGCSKTRKAVIIDPSPGSSELLLQEIKENGWVLEQILLTHSHWDHIADVFELKTKTGVPVAIHPLDVENLEHPGSDGLPLLFPIRGVKADRLLHDGDQFMVGDLQVRVIHTPGHSPGSVCFYLPDEKTLFSGDTLFRGGMGNLQLPTAVPSKMGPSLRKLALLPPDTCVVPGHGKETTIGKENWLNRAQN